MRPWRGRSRRKATSPTRRLGHVLLLVLLSVSTRAWGDAGAQETIVRVRSSKAALDERLSAELSTLGLSVREVGPIDPGASLEPLVRANGARAAVRVVEPDNVIELWVEARKGEAAIHQRVPMDPRRGWNVAAVSALEILRADLLEVRDGTPPPPPRPAPPSAPPRDGPEPPRPASPTPGPSLWAHVAAGAQSSPGGLGVSTELLGELRLELASWLDVAALGTVSPIADQVTGPEGVARVRHSLVGGVADVRMRVQSVTASLGAGAMLGVFWMSAASVAPGYGGQDASLVTAGPWLRACASLDVTPAMRVRIEIGGGATLPHARIRFGGREVADWGQPFGLATLGLELRVLE